MAPSASHGKTLPAITTRTSAIGQHDGRVERRRPASPGRWPGRRRRRPPAGCTSVRPSPRPTRQTRPATIAPPPAAATGRPKKRVVGDEHQPGDRGVQRTHPGDRDRGLGLALGAGEHDRAGDQRGGDRRPRRPRRAASRAGSAARPRRAPSAGPAAAERGTASGGRLPGLQVVLDDVGHRLDDVVVDPRRLRRRRRRRR